MLDIILLLWLIASSHCANSRFIDSTLVCLFNVAKFGIWFVQAQTLPLQRQNGIGEDQWSSKCQTTVIQASS